MRWKDDFDWQAKLIPQVKRIAGPLIGYHQVTEAPGADDVHRNADLIVFTLRGATVACRLRRHEYMRHWGDFTLRADRPSGNKTELAKVLEGFGDFFFYGYASEDETRLSAWMLADLSVFRGWHSRELVRLKGAVPGTEKVNGDGSSRFRVYEVSGLPSDFLIGTSEPQQEDLWG